MKNPDDPRTARKDMTMITPEQAIRRGSIHGRGTSKTHPDPRWKGPGGCGARLSYAWVLPRHQQSPPLSPPPPPLLPCPAEARFRPVRQPCPQRSFTIEALLQKDSENAPVAGPSRGKLKSPTFFLRVDAMIVTLVSIYYNLPDKLLSI